MKLHIKNFRSIKQLDLELAPITVLYGHNGTGKSSALYAPLTMKNIVTNPNQQIEGFFDYGFARLGTFNEVVFDHNPNNELELGISFKTIYGNPAFDGYDAEVNYRITCRREDTGSFQIKVTVDDYGTEDLEGHSPMKRTLLNAMLSVNFLDRRGNYEIFGIDQPDRFFKWDGVNTEFFIPSPDGEDVRLLSDIEYVSETTIDMMNLPAEDLRRVSFVPLGRGFFRPIYSLDGYPNTEQKVTNLLATDRHIRYAVSQRLEQILNRNFAIANEIGSANYSLDSIDRHSSISASLVNEGFGVNQLVFMLAKVLHPDSGIVCIEEPEIHLHPTAIRRLARALADIVQEERKLLLISTHSEQFIMSFLALVAEGTYSPDKLAIYHVTKEGKESEFHRQQVNENGQVEGGLSTFMEGELEDMKAFLGV